MNEKIHLLVVDDHTVVRKGLCSLLSEEKYGIEVVGEAVDGVEAIEKAIEDAKKNAGPKVIEGVRGAK